MYICNYYFIALTKLGDFVAQLVALIYIAVNLSNQTVETVHRNYETEFKQPSAALIFVIVAGLQVAHNRYFNNILLSFVKEFSPPAGALIKVYHVFIGKWNVENI